MENLASVDETHWPAREPSVFICGCIPSSPTLPPLPTDSCKFVLIRGLPLSLLWRLYSSAASSIGQPHHRKRTGILIRRRCSRLKYAQESLRRLQFRKCYGRKDADLFIGIGQSHPQPWQALWIN